MMLTNTALQLYDITNPFVAVNNVKMMLGSENKGSVFFSNLFFDRFMQIAIPVKGRNEYIGRKNGEI